MVNEKESYFLNFWQQTIAPNTPEVVVAQWKDYVFSGVERGKNIVELVSTYHDLQKSNILDVGCGYGGTSIAFGLQDSNIFGIDIEEQRLRGASIRATKDYSLERVQFQQAALERLPFADKTFDVIICQDVMEHVSNHARAISEMERSPTSWRSIIS